MLELQRVTLTFPDGDSRVTALDDVSLVAKRGEIVGIVGASGSGKSTLLSVAATLATPESGRVLLDGHDITHLSDRERARLRREKLGIVFQQSNLLPALTALDQLLVMPALAGERGGAKRAKTEEAARAMLDRVGLADKMHLRPAQLSGGQRQRVNIARALMGDPSVLLVDEPTSALDHERSLEIMALVEELTRERSTATLFVTHDRELSRSFDVIATMQDGRLDVARSERRLRAAG